MALIGARRALLRRSHTPGFYNFTGQNLTRWQSGLAAYRAGTRNAKLLCLGDSTTAGYGSTGNAFLSNAVSQSYPSQLAALLGGKTNSVLGSHNVDAGANKGASYTAYDSRITTSGTVDMSNSNLGSGLGGILPTMAATGTFSFTPDSPVDTFEFGYVMVKGTFTSGLVGGIVGVAIDGGAATNIDTSTASNDFYAQTVFNPSVGTHTLNASYVSGNRVWIEQIYAYNSAVKEISVLNAGVSAATISSLVSNTFTYQAPGRITSLAPDLTILMMEINDWNAPTALATFKSSTQSAITTCAAVGDVILVTGFPSNPATKSSLAVQQTYVDVYKQLSNENQIPLIDVWGQFFGGSWAGSGYMSDDLHPTQAGYGVMVNAVYKGLKPGFRS